MLNRLFPMLNVMKNKEIETYSQINNKDQSRSNNINDDINNLKNIDKLEKDLDEIISIKKSVMNNILSIQEKKENITLELDKVLFDNTIMLEAIMKNFLTIKDFSSF